MHMNTVWAAVGLMMAMVVVLWEALKYLLVALLTVSHHAKTMWLIGLTCQKMSRASTGSVMMPTV